MYQLTPKKKNTDGNPDYLSISDQNYKTDIFENSWFEFETNDIDNSKRSSSENPIQNKCHIKTLMWTPGYSTYCLDGKEFLVWKVSIGSNDYWDQPFFDAKVLTVAYNNHSVNLNEFETFPYQVKAMTNPDNVDSWIFWVVQEFRNSVKDNTCLKLVRPNGSLYPGVCWWKAKSLSYMIKQEKTYNTQLSFLEKLILPQAYAKIWNVLSDDEQKILNQQTEKGRGIILFDGLPIEVLNKIKMIQDKWLSKSLISSVALWVDKIIKYKKDNWLPLSNYETIFSWCDITYDDRMKNVIDFVNKINDPNKIDYKNLEYLNPKFWDCIVPFPDKKHINQEIENSFPSNKYLARIEQNKDIDKAIIDNKNEANKFINEKIILETEYNEKMQQIQKEIDSWVYIEGLNEKINLVKTEFDKKSWEIDKKIEEITKWIETNKKDKDNNIEKNKQIENNYSNPVIIVIILLLIWWIFLFIWLRRKSK